MKVFSRCKINLTLGVTGLRYDGYHLLESIMQTIDFGNIITVDLIASKEIILSSNHPDVPLNNKNTAYKAANFFMKKYDLEYGVKIHIEKHVPFQAGLGSASADAAGVLFALHKICNTKFDEIIDMSESIGADVPFCLKGGTSLAQGIGEILTPLNKMPNCTLLIVKPNFGASTPEIFNRFDTLKNPVIPNTQSMIEALDNNNLKDVGLYLSNSLERCVDNISDIKVIFDRCPLCLGSSMTGSGTAVFGIFADKRFAHDASLLFNGYFTFITKPVQTAIEILQ